MECSVHDDHNSRTTQSPVLWQNADRSVTVIDIPHSIAKAQGNYEVHSFRHLVSSSPAIVPFPSNEPRSASARAKLEQHTVNAELHVEYKRLLEEAIEDAKRNHNGLWCLPRPFVEDTPQTTKKRKLDGNENDTSATSELGVPQTINKLTDEILPSIARMGRNNSRKYIARFVDKPDHQPRAAGKSGSCEDFLSNILSNNNDQTTLFKVQSAAKPDPFTFSIPPGASFYIGDCADSHSFHTAIRNQAQRMNTTRKFDFILLDPPWPNRSVKRTHKTPGSTYSTSPSLWEIRGLILDMDLDVLMADECLVGIWITNKSGVRELVLGEEGIFACWGVEIVEEWLWLKTTACGEPLTPLDGIWRKPYELLLLGRKRRVGPSVRESVPQSGEDGRGVRRRVIIGVPDLHSRKPCLKELIEPLMPDRKDYRALEVFARHLVAGWWSWGDECIKFNWEGFWREQYGASGNAIPCEGVKCDNLMS